MAMLTSILGFSGFGLMVRFWQLGIQKKNVLHNIHLHPLYMAGFGLLGYWAEVWEVKSTALIAQKKEAIKRIREQHTASQTQAEKED